MVDRSQSLVLVTLLGTRIFPNPSVYDVVMDLRAETVPFLGGQAHSGMVIGTRNILDKSFTVLRETVEDNPGYSILVVGYSLGNFFCYCQALVPSPVLLDPKQNPNQSKIKIQVQLGLG